MTSLRTAPPFLIAAGLLVWGWQNSYLQYAIPMLLLLESSYWVKWRWSISDTEFNNISDLSSIIFFIVVLYIFNAEGSRGIFTILSIMPIIFFLLILAQQYSEQGHLKLSVLFISLRKIDKTSTLDADSQVDISLPYFVTCLVSASAGNQRTIWFFIVISILFTWLLWLVRSNRYGIVTWSVALLISISVAYAGQIGIRHLQYSIESAFMSMLDHYMWRYRDPSKATTAIGSIGRLKISDRIILRVKTDKKLAEPLLLREAAYDTYGYGVWGVSNSKFNVIDPEIDGRTWILADSPPEDEITISTYMIKEKGVIALPHGSSRIKDVGATEIEKNVYGAVSMEIREGWITYSADYNSNLMHESEPGPADLNKLVQESEPGPTDLYVSDHYKEDFQKLSNQLGLQGKKPDEIINIVENYFSNNYYYSLEQRHRYPRGKYLQKFLFENKKGHCEFFATSTVLLLRAAGIPARYAVGFSVQEYSALEGAYIARSRHAHSWALAFVNNTWQAVDTTPATWAPYEASRTSSITALMDIAAWVKYKFSRWQKEDELEEESSYDYLLWLLIPLLALLGWRLYFKERIQRNSANHNPELLTEYPGMDSSLYSLITQLEHAGHVRQPGESLTCWFKRLGNKLDNRLMLSALKIHYQYRFDPVGISREQKKQLDEIINNCTTDFNAPAINNPGS